MQNSYLVLHSAENQGKSKKICIGRDFFRSLRLIRHLHSAENFAFWTLCRTKQGPTVLRAIIFLIIGGTNIHNLLHFSLITKLVSITIVKRSFSIHHLYYICNHHIHGSSFWGTSNGLLEKRIYYSIQKLAFALGAIGPGLWLQNLSF